MGKIALSWIFSLPGSGSSGMKVLRAAFQSLRQMKENCCAYFLLYGFLISNRFSGSLAPSTLRRVCLPRTISQNNYRQRPLLLQRRLAVFFSLHWQGDTH